MECAEKTKNERVYRCLYNYYMMTEQMDKVQQLVQVLQLIIFWCCVIALLIRVDVAEQRQLIISARWTKWIDRDNVFMGLCVCL